MKAPLTPLTITPDKDFTKDIKAIRDPPVQPSLALETFLEEVKFDLASINLNRPKDNLSLGERNALKELSHF